MTAPPMPVIAPVVVSLLLAELNPTGDPTGLKGDIRPPPDLTYQLPFVAVRRFSGGSVFGLDLPVVDVDYYDNDEDRCATGAEQVRQTLVAVRNVIVDGVAIARIQCPQGPVPRDSGTNGAFRYQATYSLSARTVV